jgi:hypothetical protein
MGNKSINNYLWRIYKIELMRTLIIILLFSFNASAQQGFFFGSGNPAKRTQLIDSLITVKASGYIDNDGGTYTDAITMYYNYDSNRIYMVAGAINATIASNFHYVTDTLGNVIDEFTFPAAMKARADCPHSTIGGKLTIIGGDGNPSGNGFKDVWQFDPSIAGNDSSSWTLINADFTPAIGERILSFFTDLNGWFYLGGGQTKTNVVRTQDFINWDTVANLPARLFYSMTAACVSWDKYIVVMGGGTETGPFGTTALYTSYLRGTVYRIDTTDWSIDSVYNNQEFFGGLWGNAVANDEYIYYVKGTIHSSQLPQFPGGTSAGNQLGMVRSRDGGLTWEEWGQTLSARHATGLCRGLGQVLWWGAGNDANDLHKIIKKIK